MQLKTVTVTFQFVLAMPDDADMLTTDITAREYAKDALFDQSSNDIEMDIKDYASGQVYDWSDECIPYGGDGNTRIGQYLKGQTP